jgi:ABC-type transport system involved in Fe-S cluster assembly fused permease/ATPase subunit
MNTAFVLIFIALQIADIWTTHKALGMGKREANSILANLFTKFEPVPTMIVMKIPAVVLLYVADFYFITIALCALYVWVVLNNIDVIRGK